MSTQDRFNSHIDSDLLLHVDTDTRTTLIRHPFAIMCPQLMSANVKIIGFFFYDDFFYKTINCIQFHTKMYISADKRCVRKMSYVTQRRTENRVLTFVFVFFFKYIHFWFSPNAVVKIYNRRRTVKFWRNTSTNLILMKRQPKPGYNQALLIIVFKCDDLSFVSDARRVSAYRSVSVRFFYVNMIFANYF